MAYSHMPHYRQFGKKKSSPLRISRHVVFFLFFAVGVLIWNKRVSIPGELPAVSDEGGFSYGAVTVERVLDYAGDGETEFDSRRAEESKRQVERDETETREEGEAKSEGHIVDEVKELAVVHEEDKRTDDDGELNEPSVERGEGSQLSEKDSIGTDAEAENDDEDEQTHGKVDGYEDELAMKTKDEKEDAEPKTFEETNDSSTTLMRQDDEIEESIKTSDNIEQKPDFNKPSMETTTNSLDTKIDSQPLEPTSPIHEYDTPEEEKQQDSQENESQNPFKLDRPTIEEPSGGINPSQEQTSTGNPVPSLEEYLNFTTNTAINFMHFHKTGGVSFKTALHKFYNSKFKKSGTPVIIRDACYVRTGVSGDDKPTFALWRCDWEPIRQMSIKDRNNHDFIFGHQFWGKGAGELLNERDLRTFTVLRHPFDRKVSFYYHFFVRENGRREEDVTFEEIRDFLLYDKLVVKAELGRDLGPNYMAGRLLSDGVEGFVGNSSFRYYDVEQERKREVADKALELVRDYAFVGLQRENEASKCMLRKMMGVWNDVNGVSNEGLEEIEGGKKLNTGSYSMTAREIWKEFSMEDRIWFDRKERVDLIIYEEGEELFKKHVRLFGCQDKVKELVV